jgi:hypothetical protein
MDNPVTIIFAILFILIIYLQIQINSLKNNQENFDAPDLNTQAIANLNNLASNILNNDQLTVPTNISISGQINLTNDISLVPGTDKWLRVYSTTTKNYDAGFAAQNLWCQNGTLFAKNASVTGNLTANDINVKGLDITSTDNPLQLGSRNKWLFNTYDNEERLIIRRANGGWSDPLFILDKDGNLNVRGSISCNGTITATGNINTSSNLIAAGGVSTGTGGNKYTIFGGNGNDGLRIATGDANDDLRHFFPKNPNPKQKNWY